MNISFRTRLILLVTGMLVGAVFITTVLLGWSTRQAVLGEAEATGEVVPRGKILQIKKLLSGLLPQH